LNASGGPGCERRAALASVLLCAACCAWLIADIEDLAARTEQRSARLAELAALRRHGAIAVTTALQRIDGLFAVAPPRPGAGEDARLALVRAEIER